MTEPLFMAPQELDEIARQSRDVEAFKLALSLLSPASPTPGIKLLQLACRYANDRAELAERQNEELRGELAKIKTRDHNKVIGQTIGPGASSKPREE